jgi:hypothetical protein
MKKDTYRLIIIIALILVILVSLAPLLSGAY